MIQVLFKPLEGTLNLAATSLEAGHYCTGNPELGWVLYSRGAGGCWNQRTHRRFAPKEGMIPKRIKGLWYWIDENKNQEKQG